MHLKAHNYQRYKEKFEQESHLQLLTHIADYKLYHEFIF
jgi:hypothetical protein